MNLRNVLFPDIEETMAALVDFVEYEQQATVVRNLSGGLSEWTKAGAFIGRAAIAAEQEVGNRWQANQSAAESLPQQQFVQFWD